MGTGVPGVEDTSCFFWGGRVVCVCVTRLCMCMCMCFCVYYSFRRRASLILRSNAAFIIPSVPYSYTYAPFFLLSVFRCEMMVRQGRSYVDCT